MPLRLGWQLGLVLALTTALLLLDLKDFALQASHLPGKGLLSCQRMLGMGPLPLKALLPCLWQAGGALGPGLRITVLNV